MDTTTLLTVIDMIDNELANYKERMSAKGFDMDRMETPVQGALTKLKDNLQLILEKEIESYKGPWNEEAWGEVESADDLDTCQLCGGHINMCTEKCNILLKKAVE